MSTISPLPVQQSINKPKAALTGSKPPLLMPGPYEAAFFGHTTKIMFGGRPKLFLTFVIKTEGRGVSLQKYYNVQRLIKRNITSFEIGHKSNLFRDYVRLFGYPTDIENFTSELILSSFEDKTFICDVATVSTDGNDQPLPWELRYSIIERIKEVASA